MLKCHDKYLREKFQNVKLSRHNQAYRPRSVKRERPDVNWYALIISSARHRHSVRRLAMYGHSRGRARAVNAHHRLAASWRRPAIF